MVFEECFQDAEHIFMDFSLLQGTWLSCVLLAVEAEISIVQRLKTTEYTTLRLLPKGLIWIGTDTQISLGKHSLGQNNDTAATCDTCLLEQQAFPAHSTDPPHRALWSCCFLADTLNTGGQYRHWTWQLHLHRNPSSLGKTYSKMSLICSKRHLDKLQQPLQRDTGCSAWLLSTPKASICDKKPPNLTPSLGLGYCMISEKHHWIKHPAVV